MTLNAELQLKPVPLTTLPSKQIPAKPSTYPNIHRQQKILSDIQQLRKLLNKQRLVRVLNAHKKLRQRFHPLNSFTPPHVFNHIQIPLSVANHIYTDKGHKMSLETLLTCANAKRWDTALSNELGQLTQSNNIGITSQDAMDFIHYHEVPSTAKVTYASDLC